MSKEELKNIPASILQRLKNFSEGKQKNFGLTLSNYAIERFLYRLSISKYASQFVLKGAQLFRIWSDKSYRPTRDLDLLRFGSPDIPELERIFREVCKVKTDVQDGIEYLAETVRGEAIREGDEYDGVRIKLEFRIDRTGEFMQIDIGFGDILNPPAKEAQFPSILKMPSAKLKSYCREGVIAEKVEAMISLGVANSRMKDFFDIWRLSEDFEYDGKVLQKAIQATFKRRETEIPDKVPIVFTPEFANNPSKQVQWKAFLRKITPEKEISEGNFEIVIKSISEFIFPVFQAINRLQEFERKWAPKKGWI